MMYKHKTLCVGWKVANSYRSLSKTVAVSVICLLLAACGGGSSSDSNTGDGSAQQQEDEVQNGGEQNGGEQNGGEQNGGEQNGGEQNGGEQNGGEQNGGEQNGGEQNGGEQNGGEQEVSAGACTVTALNSDEQQAQNSKYTLSIGVPDDALEGSIANISVTVEDESSEQIETFRTSVDIRNEEAFNTTIDSPSLSNTEGGTLVLRLPLVDVDTAIQLDISASFIDSGTGSNVNVRQLACINVSDGLPSEGKALLVVGQQAPGIDNAVLRDIDLQLLSDDGFVAISGSYAIGNNLGNAIWAGQPNSLQLMLKTGDPIAGLPANTSFSEARTLGLAAGGIVGGLIELQGAGSTSAAILTKEGVPQVVARSSSLVNGLDEIGAIGVISSVVNTDNGLFFSAQAGRGIAVFQHVDDATSIVALDSRAITGFVTGPGGANLSIPDYIPRASDGCIIRYVDTPYVSRNGDIGFRALIGPELISTPQGFVRIPENCDRQAGTSASVVAWKDGEFVELTGVRSITNEFGLSIESIQDSDDIGYAVDEIIRVLDDGSIIAKGSLTQFAQNNSFNGVSATAILKMAPVRGGPVSLVLMTGESLPPNFDQNADRSLRYFLSDTSSQNLLLFGRLSTGPLVLSGVGHETQPYTDLAAPAASALGHVTSGIAGAPQGFESTRFFEALGLPWFDAAGNVRFVGKLADSADSSLRPPTGLYFTDANGVTELRSFIPGMPVQSDRQVLVVSDLTTTYENGAPTSVDIGDGQHSQVDDAGGVLISVRVDDTRSDVNNKALIYVPAEAGTF